jgi:tryptophan synthase alpha subunit
MTHKTLSVAAACAAFIACGTAMADAPGPDWITLEQAAAKAKEAGYVLLYSVDADDKMWEVKGAKQDGKVYELRLDGITGQVTQDKED